MILGKRKLHSLFRSGQWKAYRDGVRIGADDLEINPNSINVTLGNVVKQADYNRYIDPYDPDSVEWHEETVDDDGILIQPGRLYLMHVRERFECTKPVWSWWPIPHRMHFAPMLDGRSTVARLGVFFHCTAGFGDWGFDGNFVAEITSVERVLLRPRDAYMQVSFHQVWQPRLYTGSYSVGQYDCVKVPVLGKSRFQRESL